MSVKFGKFEDVTFGPQFGNRSAAILVDGEEVGVVYAERGHFPEALEKGTRVIAYYAEAYGKNKLFEVIRYDGGRDCTSAEAKRAIKEWVGECRLKEVGLDATS